MEAPGSLPPVCIYNQNEQVWIYGLDRLKNLKIIIWSIIIFTNGNNQSRSIFF